MANLAYAIAEPKIVAGIHICDCQASKLCQAFKLGNQMLVCLDAPEGLQLLQVTNI